MSARDYKCASDLILTPTNGGVFVDPVALGIPGNWIGRKPENGGNAVEPMHELSPCLTKTDRHAVCITGDITHTLKAEGFDASEDGTGRGQPIVAALGFIPKAPAGSRNIGEKSEQSPTITTHMNGQAVQLGMAVRRLTPRECARLQGFPDDYLSQVLIRGKPMADGPMYKALGNSWAVPKFAWLGARIDAALKASA